MPDPQPSSPSRRRSILGRRIREARERCRLSQRELARRCGIAHSHISQIESGRARPSQKRLEAIAEALGETMEALLKGIPVPVRRSDKPLKKHAAALRRVFPRVSVPEITRTLRVAFREAGLTEIGAELLDAVEAQRRPPAFWRVLKRLAEALNTPEQLLLLHAIANGADIERVHPHRVGFSRPVIQHPGLPFYSVVIKLECGYLVIFPQLGLPTRPGRYRTLDFMVAIATSTAALYLDTEIQGPCHVGREEQDERRAHEIGLANMQIPVAEVERRDFFARFLRSAQARLLRAARDVA